MASDNGGIYAGGDHMIRRLALVVLLQTGIGTGLATPSWAVVAGGIRVPAPHHVTAAVSVFPAKATATTRGSVSLALVGQGLVPRTKYRVDAPSLTHNCKNGVNNKTVVTDLRGAFNFSANAGPDCIAGKFAIVVRKTTSPFTTYTVQFRILAA
ncbi:MAG TPA: hypothetical protein VED63_06425 [Acidimicrobiales bacterium]|nr:hypothetical protein [Acidimicrobiales bacterium]